MNLAFVRKSPRLCPSGRHWCRFRARGIARQLREQRAVETAAAAHAQWLARASSRPPDLAHLRAGMEAEAAHLAEVRLLRELHAELEAERRQQSSEAAELPRVYRPARMPTMGRSMLPDSL